MKVDTAKDVLGRFDQRAAHVYQLMGKKGQAYIIDIAAFAIGSQCDPYLVIEDSDGKQIAAVDDGKNVVDPQLNWKAPADGVYRLRVSDLSASSVSRKSYRLSVRDSVVQGEPTLVCPETLIVPLGGKASVNLTVTPKNKAALPIRLS